MNVFENKNCNIDKYIQKWERVAIAAWISVEKRFNGDNLNMLNILKAMVRKDVNVILNTSREIRGKAWFKTRLASCGRSETYLP